FLDDVEVVIERSDLEDLALRHAHFFRKGREMPGGEMPVAVLQLVQVLDQEVGAARCVPEKLTHLGQHRRARTAALGAAALALPHIFAAGNDRYDACLHCFLTSAAGPGARCSCT